MKRHHRWTTFGLLRWRYGYVRRVFANPFVIFLGYDRQEVRADQRWRYEPGLRWKMFCQRRRA